MQATAINACRRLYSSMDVLIVSAVMCHETHRTRTGVTTNKDTLVCFPRSSTTVVLDYARSVAKDVTNDGFVAWHPAAYMG